ncbi:dethiobiotin synthase [Oceaniserpentilla sp. 4NH20-0058]|uniref:dethiobiotin synthase n=1 Tax=Oceaniserpentilla sp. 4NH20-0058 TaxID=3127660 RepID=UPI00310C642B
MSKQKFFITGTDTDAGKTVCSAALLYKASEAGKQTLGLKPVAAGCEDHGQGLQNDDALLHIKYSTEQLPYMQINPIALEEPIAPHIAAQHIQKPLSAQRIVGLVRGVLMINRADFMLIEGAGGWRVPLNLNETFADVAKELQAPVILVVGMKLGCINHALLTVEAIQRDGMKLAGWIANRVDPEMSAYDENLVTLKSLIQAPCLGDVPYLDNMEIEKVAEYIQLPE